MKKVIAAFALAFLSSCGTMGDGDSSNENSGNNNIVPSSSSQPKPSSSSVYTPPSSSSIYIRPSSSSVYVPPSSSSLPRPSSSSVYIPPSSSSVALPPNALEVTLTAYKELHALDVLGNSGDPRVSFNVRTYSANKSLLDNDTTKLLLNKEDTAEWTGTARDTVTINTTADSLVVFPIVLDADVSVNDDYSPNGASLKGPFTTGMSYSSITRANDDVSVTFGIRFIRQ